MLVADEVPSVIRLLSLELKSEGFEVMGVEIDDNALEVVESWRPDVILLEIVLPNISGFELLPRLRERFPGIPVVMLTTQDTEQDRAYAFELGAADFISKPFDPQHLSARLKAVLALKDTGPTVLRLGELEIDISRLQVRRRKTAISLTSNEWTILLALLNSNRVLTIDELFEEAFGRDYGRKVSFLSSWIQRLREKLEDDPEDPRLVVGDPERGFRIQRSPSA